MIKWRRRKRTGILFVLRLFDSIVLFLYYCPYLEMLYWFYRVFACVFLCTARIPCTNLSITFWKLKWMNETVDIFIIAVLVRLRVKVLHPHTHYVHWTTQISWCQAVVFCRFHYQPSHCQQKMQQKMPRVCTKQIQKSLPHYFSFLVSSCFCLWNATVSVCNLNNPINSISFHSTISICLHLNLEVSLHFGAWIMGFHCQKVQNSIAKFRIPLPDLSRWSDSHGWALTKSGNRSSVRVFPYCPKVSNPSVFIRNSQNFKSRDQDLEV